jgi:hypothetical protein
MRCSGRTRHLIQQIAGLEHAGDEMAGGKGPKENFESCLMLPVSE